MNPVQLFYMFAICIFIFVLLLLIERIRLSFARKAVLNRIHINGTRGKSSVTRLIYEVLSQTMPTSAKITGSKPVYISPHRIE